MLDIPIVVAAFNRKECLERLLNSLKKAFYSQKVKLIISIDGGGCDKVIALADNFQWPHGSKEVINHKKNLGLRQHILSCGRLTSQYDGIILLEDDLYVSPFFYEYLMKAHDKYFDEDAVTGIALYSHQFNETAELPFSPFRDGYDTFFLQLACSWGQSWLKHQWKEFDNWYQKNSHLNLDNDPSLPADVYYWPDTSWKKYYIKFMVENNKFFVYPRESYITNFGDAGQHHKGTKVFQVPLVYGNKEPRFPDYNSSYTKYDVFCEILPECLKYYQVQLKDFHFDVDLYGVKNIENLKADYVLTSQKFNKPVKSFARKLKPHELNVIEDIPGEDLFLFERKDFLGYKDFLKHRRNIYTDVKNIHKYYYAIRDMHYLQFENPAKNKNQMVKDIIKNTLVKFLGQSNTESLLKKLLN